jgi:hypothetical protein
METTRFLDLDCIPLKGETITHREMWQIYGDIAFEPTEDAAQAMVKELGL